MNLEKTSLIFTGDIGFDKYMDKKWEDNNLLSKPILEFFNSGEHTIANVEGAIFDSSNNKIKSDYFHAMNPNATKFLDLINADIWSIGNNHIMDAGADGLISTINIANKKGCKTIGAGINENTASQPIYIDKAGGIGIICVSYMRENTPANETEPGFFRWDNMELISKRITEIKSKCRWCIVVCHGGEEFTAIPSPYTRERYIKYLELGADIIVGHHPHVPQNYEIFENSKAIFYSLGNFIFDTDYQRAHKYTDIGVLLKLTFTKEKFDFNAIAIKINRTNQTLDITTLPDIFTNISAENYPLLSPLGAKAFISEERKKMIYLEPERFKNATTQVWEDYFNSEEPDGFVKDEHMDLSIIYPLSKLADRGDFKKCNLEKVKNYLFSLI